ncbi:MAG: MDR family MFS transporter [Chloroflexota bacterium]
MERGSPVPNRSFILVALLLGTFLTAMEATVVSTAMPTIIGDLHGLNLYAWVFSIYLLTSTATVPLYGRLADMVGRKPVFMCGIGIFLLGSALSGLAQSMPELIFFRAVQGLGAGAVQPTVFTILGDLYSLTERARIQGLFSAIWGTASVAGPALGAFITVSIGWRWVFYVNVPFGTVAAVLLWRTLHEARQGRQHTLDYAGAATLTSGIAVLLFGLLGGSHGNVFPPAIVLAFLLLAAFVLIELRAREPVLPLGMFREPFIAIPCLAGLLIGAVQFGVSSYVPLFVQGVQLGTAGDAGKALAPLSLGWPLAGFVSPRLMIRFGFRPVAILGTALVGIGTSVLVTYSLHTALLLIVANLFVLGMGLGFSSNAFLLGAQDSVGWERRGVVTASVQFTRTMGGTVGIALLGAVLNARLTTTLRAAGTADVNAVLNPSVRNALPPAVLRIVQNGLAAGLHQIYLLLAISAVGGFAVACFFPKGGGKSTIAEQPINATVANVPRGRPSKAAAVE